MWSLFLFFCCCCCGKQFAFHKVCKMLLPDNSFVVDWIGFQIFWLWIVPDESYSRNVPDEGYWAYLMKVIECTWWRLLSVPDEGYWADLMKVIPVTYLMKVIERTWWRILIVPDEGYSRNVPDEDYWAYLMKVIERTWWRILSVPDEGCSRIASCSLDLISTSLLHKT